MNVLKIIMTLIMAPFFLMGCHQQFEIYDFKSEEIKISWGYVGAKLEGSEKKHDETIIKGSPYVLSLWIGSNDFVEGDIQIEDIKLIDSKTNTILFYQNSIMAKPIKKYTNSYLAFFQIGDINLEYKDMLLSVDFVLKQGADEKKYKVDICFKKDFKKYRMIESH